MLIEYLLILFKNYHFTMVVFLLYIAVNTKPQYGISEIKCFNNIEFCKDCLREVKFKTYKNATEHHAFDR